ncbi:Os07g0474700, partial [Oryza sativa Japonica Group]
AGDVVRRLDLQAKDMIAAAQDPTTQGRHLRAEQAASEHQDLRFTHCCQVHPKLLHCLASDKYYPFPSSAPAASTINPFLTSTEHQNGNIGCIP